MASIVSEKPMDAKIPHILLMGPRRAGKSSIQRVVFYKMSPHETLFLESTNTLDVKYVANNAFVQFQIWDFPGDFDFKDTINYGGQTLTEEAIFKNCGALVYVIDAQDEPYNETLHTLHETVVRAHRVNPNILFEVFVHKVDGDLFLSVAIYILLTTSNTKALSILHVATRTSKRFSITGSCGTSFCTTFENASNIEWSYIEVSWKLS